MSDVALALREVAASPALARTRVRVVDDRLALGVIAALILGGIAAWSVSSLATAGFGSVVLGVLLAWASSKRSTRIAAHHNAGVAALNAGDFAAAERAFARALASYPMRSLASVALSNMGTSALRRGAPREAATYLRAALALARPGGGWFGAAHSRAGLRGTYAIALAATGELADAERVVRDDAALEEGAWPRAVLVCARAFVLSKAGRGGEAAALLDAERVFLRNTLAGEFAALAEALDAQARVAVGAAGAFRAGAAVDATTSRLQHSAMARAFVASVLPGGETSLLAA